MAILSLKTLILAGATCTLAACACPVTKDYHRVPYDANRPGERTAGTGVAIYEGRCGPVRPQPEPQPTVVERRVQREVPAPAPAPAEPIFREKQRK